MSRQYERVYDVRMRVKVMASEEILVRNFADSKLPLVVDYLRQCPLPSEEDAGYPKKIMLLSITVTRKNNKRGDA